MKNNKVTEINKPVKTKKVKPFKKSIKPENPITNHVVSNVKPTTRKPVSIKLPTTISENPDIVELQNDISVLRNKIKEFQSSIISTNKTLVQKHKALASLIKKNKKTN